jgi:hypothetical protein
VVAPNTIENPGSLFSASGDAIDATGASTDAYVAVTGFPISNTAGLMGIGTILNTGANGLNVRETVIDKFGNTISKVTLVAAGDSYLLDLQTNFVNVSTAYPPFTSYEVEVQSAVAGNATTYELHLVDLTPGAGGGGGGGGGSESLEQARAVGDTFTGGSVYWDDANEAVFGKASGEADQDYLRVYSDKTNHLQVFDSTKDGGGTVRAMSWQMGGTEKMSLSTVGRLTLPSSGLTYGGDVLPNADNFFDIGSSSFRVGYVKSGKGLQVFGGSGDANPKSSYADAALLFGAGGASALDTRMYRSVAKTMTFDDGSGGAADVVVTGKLTVTGAIDPSSVSLAGTAEGIQVLYFDSADGQSSALSGIGHGRLRYNQAQVRWEQSVNGGAYTALSGGVTGTGVDKRIPIWTGTTSLGSAAELTYDYGTGLMLVGATAIYGDLEAFFTNQWRFSLSKTGAVGGNVLFLVDNPSNGTVAHTSILAANDQGCGAALIANSSALTTDSGFVAGDAGVVYLTCRDIDPPAGARLVFHSGILDQAWINDGNVGSDTAKMTLKRTGELLLGSSTNFDTGRAFTYWKYDANDIRYTMFSNTYTGGGTVGARAQHALEAHGSKYAEFGQTGDTWNATGAEPELAASTTFIRGTTHVFVCATGGSFRVKSGGNNTRYQVDSDGKMAWFGAGTVAQQTVDAITNSVTAGGVNGTIADYTIVDYATDAASIRNDLYQLARAVAQHATAFRNFGLGA